MEGLFILRIISYFSLIFVVFNTVFFYDKGLSLGGLAFICTVAVNVIAVKLKNVYIKYGASILMLSGLMFFSKGIDDTLFIIFIVIAACLYHYKELERNGYGGFYDTFRKGITLLVLALAIDLLTFSIGKVGNIIAPYIMIYFLSSITILRTLRLIEYIPDSKHIYRMNLRYTSAIIIASFILSLDSARSICYFIYEKIYLVIGFLVEKFMILVGILITPLCNFLVRLGSRHRKAFQKSGGGVAHVKIPIRKDNSVNSILNNKIFEAIAGIVIIALIGYIVFRIFRRFSNKEGELEYYSEEKEFIFDIRNGNGRLNKILSNLLRPRNNNEYIRFFYVKYLRLCIKNNISIEESDTSLEVNKKAEKSFDKMSIDTMRNIYMKIRYGTFSADAIAKTEFHESFKKIKK